MFHKTKYVSNIFLLSKRVLLINNSRDTESYASEVTLLLLLFPYAEKKNFPFI